MTEPPNLRMFGGLSVWSEKSAAKNVSDLLHTADSDLVCHPREMLDLICVSDLGTWTASRTPYYSSEAKRKFIHKKTAGALDLKRDVTASSFYMVHNNSPNSPGFTPIGAALSYMIRRMAWEAPAIRPIAEYFRLIDLSGTSGGRGRSWGEIEFSPGLIETAIKDGRLDQCVTYDFWDEWMYSLE